MPKTGVLPSQEIRALMAQGAVRGPDGADVDAGQVQPSSLDLTLGAVAYRARASFLPGSLPVAAKLQDLTLHEIDLTAGAVLETGGVYIVPLREGLRLPGTTSASANPKSSTGRLDVFTRVICDRATSFDTVPAGYSGPLYAEISPRTFPVLVRSGSRLSQIRFRAGPSRLDEEETRALHRSEPLVRGGQALIRDGVVLSVDLTGAKDAVVGYRARRHSAVVDIDKVAAYPVDEFWEPVRATRHNRLILDPGEFYILASKETVQIPPDHAAEMVPFDPLVGEFRAHYAGFFDPGFGHAAAEGSGSRAVLEVRSHDVPFILEDGQSVARLVYERLIARPDGLYGAAAGSNYQGQGLRLSKHFAQEPQSLSANPGRLLRALPAG